MRNLILGTTLITVGLFVMTAQATDNIPLEAVKKYVELSNPVPVLDPGKIEVVELFWYGCPHCYYFSQTINPWAKNLPKDVNFKRIPALFGDPWDAHGQLFITLETMGVEDKIHNSVFNAIQKEGRDLTKPEDMADFVANQGVNRTDFLKNLNSLAIRSKMDQYKELAHKYGIQSVPAMIVNGKYRFDLITTGGPEQAINIADQLISKERTGK